MAGAEHAEEVVEGGTDVAHVDLDMREGGGSEGDHDVACAGGIGDPLRQRETAACVHALEHLLGAGLLERHPAFTHRAEAHGVVVDSDDREPAIGEGERQRQAHAPEADD